MRCLLATEALPVVPLPPPGGFSPATAALAFAIPAP
jgi:hypothetical protein